MTISSFSEVVADAIHAFAGIPVDVANLLAVQIVRTAAERGHAGTDYYLPYSHAFDRAERNIKIRKEFNGTNLRAVCRKYAVSKTTVYRVCKRGEAV